MPNGGFGSLIALPLQNKPRKLGNSVFLDDTATPFCDQWSFLSGIRRISRDEIDGIVRKAEAKGQVVGVRCYPVDEEEEDTLWRSSASPRVKAIADPLPRNLELILSNEIYIAKEDLPPALRNRLVRLAAFQNPEFYRAQAMRLPTYDTPRVVGCARDYPRHLGLPRGCQADLLQTLSDLTIPCSTRDERCQGDPLSVSFRGELRPEQRVAAEAMLAHETGVLSATTAFGKTVVAAWIIAQRAVNTLVLVHRRQLQEQWIEALSRFLKLPAKAIGRIGGGHKVQTGLIDVATIQSLVKKGTVDETIARYGHLVVDECHHLSAYSFEQVARSAKARFVTGLSATVMRKDGHHPIIFMQCGPVRHRVDAKAQAASRPFDHLVQVRPTGFRSLRVPNADLRVQYSELMDELTSADARTRQICRDVVRAMQDGRSPLVLTERNDHLDLLAARLSPDVQHVVVLRGGMGSKEVAKIRAAWPPSQTRNGGFFLRQGVTPGKDLTIVDSTPSFLRYRSPGEERSRST